jgi:hypothetical protein
VKDAGILVAALRDPVSVLALDGRGWTALLTIARAEQLIGTLAVRLRTLELPEAIAHLLDDARTNAEYQRRTALWEADCARRALAQYDGKVALMKGTAYFAAGLKAGEGRHIGDLDIMVAADGLAQVERMLLDKGGWEWVKEDAYDDAYYRDHMHELPPMIHKERDRMIDVHHTILPQTARPKPDAAAMLAYAVPLSLAGGVRGGTNEVSECQSGPPAAPPASGRGDLSIFAPADMVCHCAAHLIADGDLSGGLRNLWDMHCLLTEFAEQHADFWGALDVRAAHHGLAKDVRRAVRLSAQVFATEIPADWSGVHKADALFIRRMLARDEWGRGSAKFTRLIFYIRSHWLRMPPIMLAAHLWTKWRKG